jgi:hypothetical protein
MRGWRPGRNFWIALGLLAANALAWLSAPPGWELVEVEPRMAPEIAAIRDKVQAGGASGESFSVVITNQQAAETIAWYLDKRPGVPFSHPWVEFEPGGVVTGRGLAHVLGLQTPVQGEVKVELRDGVPIFTVQDLGVAGVMAPGFVVDTIRSEFESRVDFERNPLAVEITRLELGPGTATLEGVIK